MNTSCKKLFFLIFAIAALQTGKLGAQADVVDKIVMLDGEEKKGQVTEMGDTYIKFVHQGETLTYTVKKEEINKIQFSSGRVEFITESKKESPGNPLQSSMQSHHNLVAILPFSYIGLGGSRDEKMAIKAQADCYSYFQKNAGQFSYQDPITTNAILIKHGMNGDNIMGFTPGELAAMLGTEYVVFCTVSIMLRGTSTGSGTYYSNKGQGKKNTGYVVGGSSTSNEFTTSVDMKIYTDQGQNVFTQSHQSFWPTENAYEVTLQYLIKRTPLYHK